jgi:DNA-binding PadR family transcriptional regulator
VSRVNRILKTARASAATAAAKQRARLRKRGLYRLSEEGRERIARAARARWKQYRAERGLPAKRVARS